MKKRRLSSYWIFVIVFIVIIAACEMLTWNTAFCDAYTDRLFPFWLNTYGRLTGIFPFSAGAVLIVAAMVVLALEIMLAVLLIPFKRKEHYRRFVVRYSKSLLVLLLFVLWLMVMNCSALYGCSKISVKDQGKVYSMEQMKILREHIVEKCNTLSGRMQRDQDGNVVAPELTSPVQEAMRKLGGDYPRLSGFYPNPKPIPSSFLMYQAGYDGVYFPFSLEANYNTYISDIRYPHVISHELAHLKGYIYEDEANYIAFLACIGSEDERLQYSGYLSVLDYVETDYQRGLSQKPQISKSEISKLKILETVWNDACSYTPQTAAMLKKEQGILEDETMESIGEAIVDTYMEYYGATPNYAEVTKLLLCYYDGILY